MGMHFLGTRGVFKSRGEPGRQGYGSIVPQSLHAGRVQVVAQALAECGMLCLTGDRETADMLANKLKSDEARQRDAAAAEPPVP